MGDPIRILHAVPTFVRAGPQVRVVELMKGLGRAFSHRVVAVDGRLEALELVPAEIDVHPVQPGAERGGIRAMGRLLAKEAPDLLCTYNWESFAMVAAARLAGRRTHVHHEDGFGADEAARRKRRRNWARRVGLGRVQRLVVPSQRLLEIACREWSLPEERLELVLNGVDLTHFHPEGQGRDELRRSLGIPAGARVVGSVGHLRPVKRFDRLIRACAALPTELGDPGVHLVIVGAGAERGSLEALAAEAQPPGGAVHFVGHRRELAPLYRAMDVFCLSSDSEQLPVSLLEAMASGVAPAGTDVGDLAATAPRAARPFFVAAGPPEPLAEALAGLLGDDAGRARIGALARKRVAERHSHVAMVEAYRRIYSRAAG